MRRHTAPAFALLPLFTAGAAFAADALPPPWLPKDAGAARCVADGSSARLENDAVGFSVDSRSASLRPVALENGFVARTTRLQGELFTITLRADKSKRLASQFRLEGALACRPVVAMPGAARAADRRAGQSLEGSLSDPVSGLKVRWRALLRDGSNYVREELELLAPGGADLSAVALLELDIPGSRVLGTVSGSPVVTDTEFFGFEHPMADARVIDGHAGSWLRRALPLRAGVPARYSAVLGVAPRGQLRRGFQAYLESERAAPFRTFLHYNSWYDIGYFTPYTEAEALAVVGAFGTHLVNARGVRMDSFLFDDGWDDTSRLWQFSRAFPAGFGPLRDATAKFGAAPGIWLSPWGGYGPPRQARLATARAAGYEADDQGLALSGPRYFQLFHDTTVELLRRYGINQFKLDGTGSPDKVTPGSEFDSDFAAAIALIGDLRAIKPDLFINLTTGTWPSPFWLLTADSIWRGGDDHSFAGVGSDRQRWITYRDSDTYGGVVRLGPLFPLNSLMLHGIIYARKAQGLDSDPHGDFRDEVRSYFASGTGLQEMYVSPDLLTERNWDDLAAAAKWARANAAVLRDSHWIGGDPARGEIYGWSAWASGRATLALRNPAAHPQSFELDVGAALELPESEARTWRATPAYGQGPTRTLDAGRRVVLTLRPFEVLVWDLAAVNPSRD
ncbi:MAG: enterotoxin [Gammaproteobacteria bacterium]|nr:enterotoxin [Gammaproteobacteria bacterium]